MQQDACGGTQPRGIRVERSDDRSGEVDPRKITTSTIIGDKIMNWNGEELGKIEEVVLDLTCGTISYVVLSVGGFAGVGDKFFAVPLDFLTMDTKSKSFYLDIGKKALKTTRGFDKQDWPQAAGWPPGDGRQGNMRDSSRDESDTGTGRAWRPGAYGVISASKHQASGRATTEVTVMRARKNKDVIIQETGPERVETGGERKSVQEIVAMSGDSIKGTDVVNLQNEDLGKIHDIVIDMKTGCISYAVLASGGVLGQGEKLFAIPWEALTVADEQEFIYGKSRRFILSLPKQALKESEGFDRDDWPSKPDREWLVGVYTKYGLIPYWEKH